ncbi:unnamed protein product [Closterium sp. Naga37s-1]|nr:unnamed protein product [Closterium sp. Naga37s-1]
MRVILLEVFAENAGLMNLYAMVSGRGGWVGWEAHTEQSDVGVVLLAGNAGLINLCATGQYAMVGGWGMERTAIFSHSLPSLPLFAPSSHLVTASHPFPLLPPAKGIACHLMSKEEQPSSETSGRSRENVKVGGQMLVMACVTSAAREEEGRNEQHSRN